MTPRQAKDLAIESNELMKLAAPAFAGRSPVVVGAALADLLAIWIAGHVIEDDPRATDRLHANLLRLHVNAVKSLIPVNHGIIMKNRNAP